VTDGFPLPIRITGLHAAYVVYDLAFSMLALCLTKPAREKPLEVYKQVSLSVKSGHRRLKAPAAWQVSDISSPTRQEDTAHSRRDEQVTCWKNLAGVFQKEHCQCAWDEQRLAHTTIRSSRLAIQPESNARKGSTRAWPTRVLCNLGIHRHSCRHIAAA